MTGVARVLVAADIPGTNNVNVFGGAEKFLLEVRCTSCPLCLCTLLPVLPCILPASSHRTTTFSGSALFPAMCVVCPGGGGADIPKRG
jgi:hypothetical protein